MIRSKALAATRTAAQPRPKTVWAFGPEFRRDPRTALALIVGAAFLARILWQLRVGLYVQPEVWESDAVARNLVEGRGFLYHYFGTDWLTFGTPAYPVLLAALHVLGGGAHAYWLIGLVEAGMSSALGIAAYAIGRQIGDARVGLIAASVVAAHPALVIYAGKVHEMTFEALIAATFLALALRARHPTGRRGAIALGFVGGLGALTRPTLGAFAALTLAVLAFRRPRWPILAAGLVALALAAPWTIRNAVVLGTAATGAPFTCLTLWIGNNPNAGGGTLSREGRNILATIPPEMIERIEGRPEQEQGRVFCEEAFGFIAQDPVSSLGWWMRKLAYFWWFAPHEGALYPAGWIDAYRPAYAVEIVLAAAGTVLLWRRAQRYALALVAAQLVVVSVAQSFFYVDGRHRLLLEPTLAALSAVSVAATFATLGRLRRRGAV